MCSLPIPPGLIADSKTKDLIFLSLSTVLVGLLLPMQGPPPQCSGKLPPICVLTLTKGVSDSVS